MSAFTRTQGYRVTVARSTGGRKYWLKCDRGGPPCRVLEEKRKRKEATKICDCKFQLYARIKKDGLWYLTVKYGDHNHPPTLDIAGHPAERRLNKKQKLMVELNIKAGVSPRETLTALRLEEPGTLTNARTIYNERVHSRKEHLKGKEPMEALLDDFLQK